MIYVTGDFHGRELSAKRIEKMSPYLTADDELIIAGDFGYIWGNKALSFQNLTWLSNKLKCTILFVDGNHEDFDTISEMETIETKYGTEIGRITNRIYHLLRNHVYTIEGKKILACGGAHSTDKDWRIPHISWWPQEYPTQKELKQLSAIFSNKKVTDSLNFVISHEAPSYIKRLICGFDACPDEYTEILDEGYYNHLYDSPNFTCWYFGHLHEDTGCQLGDKIRGLYYDIVPLTSKGESIGY